MQRKAQPLAARFLRQQKYGPANQLAHESRGRQERADLRAKMAAGKAEAKARGRTARTRSAGRAGGTAGSGLRRAFFAGM